MCKTKSIDSQVSLSDLNGISSVFSQDLDLRSSFSQDLVFFKAPKNSLILGFDVVIKCD